jgi:hypothetical protein
MSTRIAKLLLFVSTSSKSSIECVGFLQQNRIPDVSIIRLDTEEAREQAASGSMFQITVVPSLVVLFEDGNLQMFVGLPKIISWFKKMMQSASNPPRNTRPKNGKPKSSNIYDTDPSEMQEREPMPLGIGPLPIPRGLAKQRPGHKQNIGYRAPIIDEGDDMEEYGEDQQGYNQQEYNQQEYEDYGEDYNEPQGYEDYGDQETMFVDETAFVEEEPVPVPKKKATSKKKKAPKKTKAKVTKATNNTDPGVREAKEKLNRAASSKNKAPADKMKNVYANAKKMQQDMSASLGYKEEDLPHY